MCQRRLIGPVQIFDDQQARPLSARMLEYPGGHPLPTQTAGAAVHRFVDTPQFWRLRQIEHVVKEDRVVARYQIGRQRRGGDRTALPRCRSSAQGQADCP